MESAIQDFLNARERYQQLDLVRTQPRSPQQRDQFYIELMYAWLELHYYAQVVAGLRFAEGMQFAKVN